MGMNKRSIGCPSCCDSSVLTGCSAGASVWYDPTKKYLRVPAGWGVGSPNGLGSLLVKLTGIVGSGDMSCYCAFYNGEWLVSPSSLRGCGWSTSFIVPCLDPPGAARIYFDGNLTHGSSPDRYDIFFSVLATGVENYYRLGAKLSTVVTDLTNWVTLSFWYSNQWACEGSAPATIQIKAA